MTPIYVTKRNGSHEVCKYDKIFKRIEWLADNPYQLTEVNKYELTATITNGLTNYIKTSEIDDHTADLAASLGARHMDYLTLAGRIVIDNHHKSTLNSFSDKINILYLRKDATNKPSSAINYKFNKFVSIHKKKIDAHIDYDRDYNISYFGFRTLKKGYLLTANQVIIERPQDLFMRVAIALYMPLEIEEFRDSKCLENIFRTYDNISNGYYTHATPTLFNAGGNKSNLSSCFLLGSDDSKEGILKTLYDSCIISSESGGVGLHFEMIRGEGSLISRSDLPSKGIIPFLRMYNAGALAFDQGGKRSGSWAVYQEMHHPDIKKFLCISLKDDADENARCLDLFPALWISDLFMQRVQNNDKWHLFCPNEFPGLNKVYGEEYTKLYLKYEKEVDWTKNQHHECNAMDLWKAIKLSHEHAGLPYMMYKDNVNRANMMENIDIINSSNLCVSGDTMILLDIGYHKIKDIYEERINHDPFDIITYNVWNGTEFAPAFIDKTGINKELLKIKTHDGTVIKCTPEHKFILIIDGKEKLVEAKNLKCNDELIQANLPVVDSICYNLQEKDCSYYNQETIKNDPISVEINPTGNKLYRVKYHKLKDAIKDNYGYSNNDLNNSNFTNDFTNYLTDDLVNDSDPNMQRNLDYDNYNQIINSLTFNQEAYNTGFLSGGSLTFYKLNNDDLGIDINSNLSDKISWLSGFLDNYYEMSTIDLVIIYHDSLIFANNFKLLCHTIGLNPIINEDISNNKFYKRSPFKCTIIITTRDLYNLSRIGLFCKKFTIDNTIFNSNNVVSRSIIKSVERLSEKEDTYCFKEPKKSRGIFNGLLLGNCTEIILPSNTQEYATCNLSSICLPRFVYDTYSEEELKLDEKDRRKLNNEFPKYPKFNYKLLAETAAEVTENLNNVIDRTYNPLIETARGNFRNRPIGIGIQGLADVFLKFQVPFESEYARDINKKISEAIYYGALTKSTEICRKAYHSIIANFDPEKGYTRTIYPKNVLEQFPALEKENIVDSFKDKADIPKTIGSYITYLTNGGSHMSRGQFHWERYNLESKDLSGMFDWETLRNHILTFGVRNSVLTAYMPTGTTSQIMGCSPCIEPYTSNLYRRTTLIGSFIVANKYLAKYLQDNNLYDENICNYIISAEGSIQNIDGIPDNIKELYKTAWEIKQKAIVQMAIDRQPFVDQSQSMNLWFEKYTDNAFTSAQFFGWKNGLKTGSYYIRTREAVMPQKFTISPNIQSKLSLESISKESLNMKGEENDEEICLVCSS